MRPARLRRGDGQVTLCVKLARGGKMNQVVTVTWDVQPEGDAMERFAPLSKMVVETATAYRGRRNDEGGRY